MRPKINFISLAVDDLKKSLAFYKDGIGLATKGISEGEDHILIELEDDFSIVLFLRTELDKVANQSESTRTTSEIILSHTCENKEEVDSILERAIMAGGSLLPGQPKEYDWGYSGHFQDLDGHIWEIVYFQSN